jgi:hypothetical protein
VEYRGPRHWYLRVLAKKAKETADPDGYEMKAFVTGAVSSPIPSLEEKTMLFRSRIVALILIVVGTLLLISNLGWIPQLRSLFHQWWPLLLIIVGVLMLGRRL